MMSGLSLLFTAMQLLALVMGGNSQLHLQVSFVTEPEDVIQMVVLKCTESVNGHQQVTSMLNEMPKDLLSRPEMNETHGHKFENAWFKLNGSVIEENITSLTDYKILNSHETFAYMAQFELPPLERFIGTFSCERNVSNNISVSNDLVLVYQQLEPFFKGITKATLHAILVTLISLWMITVITLVVSCAFNCKLRRALIQKQVTRKASSYNLADPPLSRGTIPLCQHWDGCKSAQSQLQSTPSKRCFSDNNTPGPLYFSSGNEIPTSSKVSYQYNADTISLSSNCSSSVDSLSLTKAGLNSPIVTKLQQPLRHSISKCSISNCPCKQVKEKHSTLHKKKRCSSFQKVEEFDKNPLHVSLPLPLDRQLTSYQDSDLDRISYPDLEPADTGNVDENQSLISFIDVATVTFNSTGGFYDNKQHGISLKIPNGAIPPGKTICIEIGVFLNSPLLIPSDSIPISPIVKLCVVGDPYFRFLKPIEVKLPHCMDITDKRDIKRFDVKFVKAQHNQLCIHETDGKTNFEPHKDFGILNTEHFCFYCITANKKQIDPAKIKYRFTKIIPRDTCTATKRWRACFCVTYFLPTCYRALEKQFNSQDYKLQSLDVFAFSNPSSPDACIEIEFERSLMGGWNLNLESPRNKIYAKEVEFWSNDSEFLQQMEAEGLYPPRFILQVSGRQAHQTTCAAIHFKGATKPMKVDLLLEPELGYNFLMPLHLQPLLTTSPSSWSVPDNVHLNPAHRTHKSTPPDSVRSSKESLNNEPSFKDLMNNVAAVIPTEWRTIGIQLGLEPAQLHAIAVNNPSNSSQCFMAVFEMWRKHDTRPPFQWSTLIEALRAPSVNQIRLAKTLQHKFVDTETDAQLQVEE